MGNRTGSSRPLFPFHAKGSPGVGPNPGAAPVQYLGTVLGLPFTVPEGIESRPDFTGFRVVVLGRYCRDADGGEGRRRKGLGPASGPGNRTDGHASQGEESSTSRGSHENPQPAFPTARVDRVHP